MGRFRPSRRCVHSVPPARWAISGRSYGRHGDIERVAIAVVHSPLRTPATRRTTNDTANRCRSSFPFSVPYHVVQSRPGMPPAIPIRVTRNRWWPRSPQGSALRSRYGFLGGCPFGVGVVPADRPVFGDVPAPGRTCGRPVDGSSKPCTVRRSTSRSSRSLSPPVASFPPPVFGDTPAPDRTGGLPVVCGVFTFSTGRFTPT